MYSRITGDPGKKKKERGPREWKPEDVAFIGCETNLKIGK